MKYLLVLNDQPYGSERPYNGLRLAMSLSKRQEVELRLFLMADATACAKASQQTPSGYYNLERMIKALVQAKTPVGVCGSCMDARGLDEPELTSGAHRSSMDEFTDWVEWADKVIVF